MTSSPLNVMMIEDGLGDQLIMERHFFFNSELQGKIELSKVDSYSKLTENDIRKTDVFICDWTT